MDIHVEIVKAEVVSMELVRAGCVTSNGDMWTAEINIGNHFGKIEIHDEEKYVAEALRDYLVNYLNQRFVPGDKDDKDTV